MSLTDHKLAARFQSRSADLKPVLCLSRPVARERKERAARLRFFTAAEFELVEIVSELIIPSDEHSPGALAAEVPAYLDLIVSEMPPAERGLWRDGLAALDKLSKLEYGRDFRRAGASEQTALLSRICRNEFQPSTLEERFFVEIKNAVIKGFYTSEIGLHIDLQYRGNTFVEKFEGCTHPEHQL